MLILEIALGVLLGYLLIAAFPALLMLLVIGIPVGLLVAITIFVWSFSPLLAVVGLGLLFLFLGRRR